MELWVVRHAIAEDRSPAVAESDRALTPEGRERFDEVTRALKRLGVRFDAVLSSPWRRAVETARQLDALADAAPVATETLLGAPGAELLAALAETGAMRLAVVGHEPWLSELVALLVAGDAGGARLRLKKGGVARLQGEPVPGGMELLELLPPKVLRRV